MARLSSPPFEGGVARVLTERGEVRARDGVVKYSPLGVYNLLIFIYINSSPNKSRLFFYLRRYLRRSGFGFAN